jgi:hypothetical protein
LLNKIGCIIDYHHMYMFKETSNFTRWFFFSIDNSIMLFMECSFSFLCFIQQKKMLKARSTILLSDKKYDDLNS